MSTATAPNKKAPILEPSSAQLKVIWTASNGEQTVIADTREGYRVLETDLAPTYYLPPAGVNTNLLSLSEKKQTRCPWKGWADYYDLHPPDGSEVVKGRIWAYNDPTDQFIPVKGYYAFYPSAEGAGGKWHAEVDGKRVDVGQSEYYGEWKTE